MSGFQPAGREWLLRGFLVGLLLRGSPPTVGSLGSEARFQVKKVLVFGAMKLFFFHLCFFWWGVGFFWCLC